MGLLNQFISSAVKQVGRDGGKVISNKIYGNAHSSKVNIVNNDGQYNSSKDVYSYSEQGLNEGDIIYGGSNYFNIQFGHWIWLFLFAALPFLGLLISLIIAYYTFLVKHIQSITPLIWKTVRIKDSRKKEGFRETEILTLDTSKQEFQQLEIPKTNRVYSIMAFSISLASTLIILGIRK